MADNQKKKKLIPNKTPSKPNYQIWIIVALLLLVFGVTYFNKAGATKEIKSRYR